ncbi:hypothetical protein, partial [Pseudomonas viridiflava]|uniref:hypothetical protein n=1 Tax=Pseudomonas viridiflava TaxID=33069 RepID=UPI0013CE56EB
MQTQIVELLLDKFGNKRTGDFVSHCHVAGEVECFCQIQCHAKVIIKLQFSNCLQAETHGLSDAY